MATEPTGCFDCKTPVTAYHYCDEDPEPRPRCGECFEKIGCWSGHEEDCATNVFEDGYPDGN